MYQTLQKPHGLSIMTKFGSKSKLMGQDGCNINFGQKEETPLSILPKCCWIGTQCLPRSVRSLFTPAISALTFQWSNSISWNKSSPLIVLVVFSFNKAWKVSNSISTSCCWWTNDSSFDALVPCSSAPPET